MVLSLPIILFDGTKQANDSATRCGDWLLSAPSVWVQVQYPYEEPKMMELATRNCDEGNFETKGIQILGLYDGMTADEYNKAKKEVVRIFPIWGADYDKD